MATDVVGSKMPALASDALKPSKAGYGQNGYAGASSDMPGEQTSSGFLPAADLAGAKAWDQKIRNRPVDATPITPAFGMTQRSPRGK
jgi:hypothetical protein